MDRLYTLRETLPKNIEDNADYPFVEFVVLDYNSKDGLGDWIKENMMPFIESGIVSYYRTEEPQYFSMSHSRNIAFRVASGDIVNNLDADNFTNQGFASRINEMAQLGSKDREVAYPNPATEVNKVMFGKGKKLLRGRLGFFKSDFVNLLGGYDEDLQGYGHDDRDLYNRAMKLEFNLLWFGGQYVDRIKTSRAEKVVNMKIKDWKKTENMNKEVSKKKIDAGIYKANQNRHWGKATLIKNFDQEIQI